MTDITPRLLGSRYAAQAAPAVELTARQADAVEGVKGKTGDEYQFTTVDCCVCDGNSFDRIAESDRYGFRHSVGVCDQCGLVFTNPRMTRDSLARFYEDDYRDIYISSQALEHAESEAAGQFEKQYDNAEEIASSVTNATDMSFDGAKVLDIGAATGGTLKYFCDRGAEVCGCDLGSRYLRYGREERDLDLRHGTIFDIDLDWSPDLVIYSDTLEHTVAPDKQLSYIRNELVNDGTVLYLRLPNVRALRQNHRDFKLLLQNAHTFYFTPTTIRNLCGTARFEAVRISPTQPMHCVFRPADPEGWTPDSDSEYPSIVRYLQWMEYTRPVYEYAQRVQQAIKTGAKGGVHMFKRYIPL